MKKFFCAVCLLAGAFCTTQPIYAQQKEYVVLASNQVSKDPSWEKVALELQRVHKAALLYYNESPNEIVHRLKELYPRYVAIVAKPEELDREFVKNMHVLCRQMDNDIYADFLWGIITGYNAEAAIRMVKSAQRPLVVKTAIATVTELKSAKWFDKYAWLDDFEAGLYGEKNDKNSAVNTVVLAKEQVAKKFNDMYSLRNPDLIITGSHASQKDLQIPFRHNAGVAATIHSKDGQLFINNAVTGEDLPLKNASDKPRVYLPIANCLIGDVNKDKNSMAIAWMKTANIAAYVGYVVNTWYGRSGWGALKYWLTTPGRNTVAEATYLNQQDLLTQLNDWGHYSQISAPRKLTAGDKKGFEYDRDVLAYYGDPMWDARLQPMPEEDDFRVTSAFSGKKYIITIQTKPSFNMERLAGGHFKEEHVLDLPFSYFFKKRLKNPALAEGQSWKAAVDENFLLVYNPNFEPNKTYTITLNVD